MEMDRAQLQLARHDRQERQERLEIERMNHEFEMKKLELEFKRFELLEKGIDVSQQQKQKPIREVEADVDVDAGVDAGQVGQADDVDDAEDRAMMMTGSRQLSRGFKIQRYNADGTLVETYQGEVDTLRHFPDTTATLLKKAIKTRTIYKGFRWMFLEKEKPDNEVQEIGESKGKVKGRYGPIAVLTLDKRKIEHVFPTQKAVAEHFNFTSTSAVSQAITKNTMSRGHYIRMWDECSTDLQQAFLLRHTLPEVPPQADGHRVAKLHPGTLKPIKIYNSVGHATKVNHVASKTLRLAIESGELLQGFRWSIVDGAA